MAENRKTFDEAMRAAADAAWEGNWGEAVEAYREALAQAPEDVEALTGLGMAYAQIGKHSEASAAYRRAADLAPRDPVLLERVGKALEGLGRQAEACTAYLSSGEQYLEQKQAPELALACWESAARVDPGCVEARVNLLKQYQARGQIREATEACVDLARLYDEQGRPDYGIRICKHALRLSPRDSEALGLLDSLQRGRRRALGDRTSEAPATQVESKRPEPAALPDAETLDFRAQGDEGISEKKGSPIERTRRRALAELAERVFEEDDVTATGAERARKAAVSALLGKAVDYHTRGRTDDAIAAYQSVLDEGVDGPAVRFNLGLLYRDRLRYDEAIRQFASAVTHADYTLGGHFALGECFVVQGRVCDALDHFLEVLKIVDLAVAAPDQANGLGAVYENLNGAHVIREDEDAALQFADSIVSFLNEERWQEKVKEVRRLLDGLTLEGSPVTLAEALTVPNAKRMFELMARAQEYVRCGMHYSAVEECHLAVDGSPGYLPIHRQLAQISRQMGRVEQAVKRLGVIARTYEVRGGTQEAAAIYREALKLAPMDTDLRLRLVDLLDRNGETEQALRQYLVLADSYERLAQMDKALEIYEAALRLAVRVDEQSAWRAQIMHKVGDIAMRRVDWTKALSVYGEIRDLVPGDERARLILMELHYRLKKPRQALRELDGLLAVYEREGRQDEAFPILADLVEKWPDAIALRARLAQAYLNAGNREKALEHLDRLGDMQLEAGQVEQAKATIRAIVALRPAEVGGYQELLLRMQGD